MSSANTSNPTRIPIDPNSVSDRQAIKDAGYRNMLHFFHSYGIKDITNDDDLAEGKAILKGLKEQMYGGGESGFVVEADKHDRGSN